MCSVNVPASARDSILRQAMSVFAAQGIEATSLRQVAKGVGVSPALVVHHFGSKEGLVAAVDEAAVREFGSAYAAGQPGEGPELLRRWAEQTATVMREHPEVCAYLG
ncbi:MAG TPA: helix-turn-helix domain-containing protein, partial [Solirubrobacterales bacterium]|nr:helix-turn-helix domain-containing protein [Solirubrobacterales bacterium]